MRWCAVLILVACGSKDEPPPAPVPVPAPVITPPPVAPPPQTHARMHAGWSHVRAQTDCWFFSGPDGRDTKLAGDISFNRHGDTVTATIGGATFTGTYRDNVLQVARVSQHQADGTWNVHEKIEGDYVGGKMIARYHYDECLVGTRCPNRCTIEATLSFTL